MGKHKIIGEMYGVLLSLKNEYENTSMQKEDFQTFSRKRVFELYGQAFDWLVEDERESNNKIAQD